MLGNGTCGRGSEGKVTSRFLLGTLAGDRGCAVDLKDEVNTARRVISSLAISRHSGEGLGLGRELRLGWCSGYRWGMTTRAKARTRPFIDQPRHLQALK